MAENVYSIYLSGKCELSVAIRVLYPNSTYVSYTRRPLIAMLLWVFFINPSINICLNIYKETEEFSLSILL